MLDGFVKVMVYFRNAIYSFLYSCALLEKLALSNGTTILSAAFSIGCNCFGNMSSYAVSWDGSNHTCEFRISKACSINPLESSKWF